MSEVEIPPKEKKYAYAANGAGIIVCQQRSRNTFRALLSNRMPVVGMGLGITGGGFVEVAEMLGKPVGTIAETALDARRESHEENIGFYDVFDEQELLERAQPIASLLVRTDDINKVHATNYYALSVTHDEWERVAALPPGPERHGPLFEVWVDFTDKVIRRLEPEVGLTLMLDDGKICEGGFYHQHELRALGMIAWHIQTGRLWAPPASGEGGSNGSAQ
jgi:hypothetical protein